MTAVISAMARATASCVSAVSPSRRRRTLLVGGREAVDQLLRQLLLELLVDGQRRRPERGQGRRRHGVDLHALLLELVEALEVVLGGLLALELGRGPRGLIDDRLPVLAEAIV